MEEIHVIKDLGITEGGLRACVGRLKMVGLVVFALDRFWGGFVTGFVFGAVEVEDLSSGRLLRFFVGGSCFTASARFFFFFFLFFELVTLTTTVLVEVCSDTCVLVCTPAKLVTVSAFWVLGSVELCWG